MKAAMRNFLELWTLHSKTRSATRMKWAASCAVLRWCQGTWATGRATPGFLARLDRRVAAPAAGSSSGVALPVARPMSFGRHKRCSRSLSGFCQAYGHHATDCRAGLGSVKARRFAPPAPRLRP